MNRLERKVALITGAAPGMGAARPQALAKVGARLVFRDLADTDGRKVEEELRAADGETHYVHVEVAR